MQVFSQIIAYLLGALAYILLTRLFDRFAVRLVAQWFWKSLFYTGSQARFRFLHFLSLGWSLFPWLTFLTLFIASLHGSLNAFLSFGIVLIVVRVFNTRLWSQQVDLFEGWLGEQGYLKQARPQWTAENKLQIDGVLRNLAKQQAKAASETRYYDSSLGFIVLSLGVYFLLQSDSQTVAASQLLWFVSGLSCALGLGFFNRVQWFDFFRYLLPIVGILFLNPKMQTLALFALTLLTVMMGVLRDVRTDLEREINPLSTRRGSGELEIVDAQKIIRLRAVREFGDTMVLGRPYKILLTVRDIVASPSIRWSLARIDGGLAVLILVAVGTWNFLRGQ